MLQDLQQLSSPLLDSLQHCLVSPVLGMPELGTALQGWPQLCWVGVEGGVPSACWQSCSSCSPGCSDPSLQPGNVAGCSAWQQHPLGLSSRAALQPLGFIFIGAWGCSSPVWDFALLSAHLTVLVGMAAQPSGGSASSVSPAGLLRSHCAPP